MYTSATAFRRNAGLEPVVQRRPCMRRNTVTSLRKRDACKTLAAVRDHVGRETVEFASVAAIQRLPLDEGETQPTSRIGRPVGGRSSAPSIAASTTSAGSPKQP